MHVFAMVCAEKSRFTGQGVCLKRHCEAHTSSPTLYMLHSCMGCRYIE